MLIIMMMTACDDYIINIDYGDDDDKKGMCMRVLVKMQIRCKVESGHDPGYPGTQWGGDEGDDDHDDHRHEDWDDDP